MAGFQARALQKKLLSKWRNKRLGVDVNDFTQGCEDAKNFIRRGTVQSRATPLTCLLTINSCILFFRIRINIGQCFINAEKNNYYFAPYPKQDISYNNN